LLVLNNQAIVDLVLEKENSPKDAVMAFGKDFGLQYMEPLTLNVSDVNKATKASSNINNIQVRDLVDHWEAGTSSEWTSASSLKTQL
jgi:hypothetical protein